MAAVQAAHGRARSRRDHRARGLHFYDQFPRARIERIFGTNPDGGLKTSVSKLDWLGAAEGAPPPRDGTGWTIEILAPRRNVLAPPSIHPATLKPYRGAR